MLSTLIKMGKKILLCLIICAMLTTNVGNAQSNDYIKWSTSSTITTSQMQQRKCDIIVRAGEWTTNEIAKPGKRVYINGQTVNVPNDIPIRNDNDGKGFYIHEGDINKKIATKVYNELKARGVNVKLQIASGKSEDLNASARICNKSNPYIYLSLHHNSYNGNAKGYFSMYNQNDELGKQIATRLSDSIKDNGQVSQRDNRANANGYIGELRYLNNTTRGVLMELGFFDHLSELEKICSDSYTDYVATHLADELVKILNEIR